MSWATLLAGLGLLLSTMPSGILSAVSANGEQGRWKRSIDLNDVYYSKMRQYRLPSDVTPVSYHVEIAPLIDKDRFNGRVKINFTWADMSDKIILNVHQDLQISAVNIRMIHLTPEEAKKGPPLDVDIARTERQYAKSWFIVHLQQMLSHGSACEVDIAYSGNLTTNETTGLYKSAYMDSEGQKHTFIATYLHLDNAEKMFPCMNEPPYKATFKLTVVYPKELTARTNTPSIERVESSDTVREEFEETPRMSTNQLALVISDLECIEPSKARVNEINGKRLQVKVWSRKEFMGSLSTVPDKVVTIVDYLQDYFNSSLGLAKLDLMAIPMYRATKASDNWGLMFFKESELGSSLYWTTTYELLYQWIGQYITPYRRNDAPVNKALNSFLASMATLDLNPDEMEGKWPMTMLYPLYYEFAQPAPFSRVAGIRHEATWTKAELVFRMLNYTLGREQFQRSVRNFFHEQSKENRRTFFANDVFTYLNNVATDTSSLPPGLTINGIVASWINRDRVPLVTVIRDYKSGKIYLSQKVYLRDLPSEPMAKPYQWDIPIVMQAQDKLDFSNSTPAVWLMKKNMPRNFSIPDITDESHFIIVNPEEIGMFPVNYDPCNWKMLSQFLQGPDREKIPPLTRAKLLHDAWNLAYAGELCFDVAMNMTLFLKQEKSHVVWEPVFTMIHHISRRIEGLDVYPKFEAYIRSLMMPLYLELGETAHPREPSWKTHMRGLMKNFLCRGGYEPCVKEARDQFKKWLTDEEPDKGNPVANKFLCPVFKWGTDEEWEFGLQRVINFPKTSLARKQNERTYLLKTLAGCPKDANRIERLLQVSVLDQNENFTDGDIHLILSMLTGSAPGYTSLFNFLLEHWHTVKERFNDKTYIWDAIVNFATSSFNTQEGYDMVNKFYLDHVDDFESAAAIIKKSLEVIKEETRWNMENVPMIDAWLMENLSKEDLDAITSTSAPSTITVPLTTD